MGCRITDASARASCLKGLQLETLTSGLTMGLKAPRTRKGLWSPEQGTQTAIGPPDLTSPSPTSSLPAKSCSPRLEPKATQSRLKDSGKAFPNALGPSSLRGTWASLDILVYGPVSFQREACLLKTLFYLLQLQIHGSRHLDSLSAPARWEKAGKKGGGRARLGGSSPFLLRLRRSRAAWFPALSSARNPPSTQRTLDSD